MWWLSPMSWLLCAMLLAGIAWRVQRVRRWLLPASLSLATLAVVAMTPLVANALLRLLEPDTALPAHCRDSPPDVAVVLAGGVDGVPATADDISKLTLASRRRAERAVFWWQERPGRKLLISGGTLFTDGAAESRVMATYVGKLGVPKSSVEVEDQSTNTWDGARALAAMRPALPRSLVLITSSVHLRRAVYAMTQAGFQVCPLATDSRLAPFGLPGYVIPQSSAMEKTEAAMHELVGLAYYRWRALRDPAPATQ